MSRRTAPDGARLDRACLELHPQTRDLLRLIEATGSPSPHLLTAQEARDAYRRRGVLVQPPSPEVALALNLTMPGAGGSIPLRLYRPKGSIEGRKLPALIFYHGGGWVVGDLDTHDTLCRGLANESGCAIVAVDYRLAPEHRFPAAVDDAIAALEWVATHGEELAIDQDRIAVGGDSAGANLAAVVALSARESGAPAIRFQLLIYPVTDMRRIAPSHHAYGQGYLLTEQVLMDSYTKYIGDETRTQGWRASPLLHPDLSGLPPAFVLTAGFDPLRDEGAQYAQRLTEAGNRASLVCFERQIHGFVTMGRVIDEAQVALRLCAAQLQAELGSS